MDLNKFRKYDLSYVEVLIENLNNVFDIKLEEDKTNFLKDSSYTLKFFKYFFLYDNFPNVIRKFLNVIEKEEFIFTNLPLEKDDLKPMTRENVLDWIESQLGYEARCISEDNIKPKGFNTLEGFPLLFDNVQNLLEFLNLSEEERGNCFSMPAIIFPTSLNWFWFFDYDYLNVVYFAFKESLIPIINRLFLESDIEYSEEEIKDIKNNLNNLI